MTAIGKVSWDNPVPLFATSSSSGAVYIDGFDVGSRLLSVSLEAADGNAVGGSLGNPLGTPLGKLLGIAVGFTDGSVEGDTLGKSLGMTVGDKVGENVEHKLDVHAPPWQSV